MNIVKSSNTSVYTSVNKTDDDKLLDPVSRSSLDYLLSIMIAKLSLSGVLWNYRKKMHIKGHVAIHVAERGLQLPSSFRFVVNNSDQKMFVRLFRDVWTIRP